MKSRDGLHTTYGGLHSATSCGLHTMLRIDFRHFYTISKSREFHGLFLYIRVIGSFQKIIYRNIKIVCDFY